MAALTVATPTFALEDNVLTITTATEGAAIHYTTDGSEPTTESTLYTAPITLTGNCMVKAFAVKEGRYDSPIAEYPVNWFKVADVVFSVSGLQLAMATETEGATIRYTTDGTLPSAEVGTEYTAPIEVASLGDDCTVQAFAMKANFSQSEVTVFEYHRVNYVTATPSIDFHEADSTVTISCATEGSAIHYTLDGSEPTVEEIAAQLQMEKSDVVLALEAIVEPLSLYDPVYNDGGDTIYVMDQLGDNSSDKDWIDEIMIKEELKHLDKREKRILHMRFMQGKTQMETAEEIGISQAQVSRLEKNVINRIKGKH